MEDRELDQMAPDAYELPRMPAALAARLLEETSQHVAGVPRRARRRAALVFVLGLAAGLVAGRSSAPSAPAAHSMDGPSAPTRATVPSSPLPASAPEELAALADRMLERDGDVRGALDLYGDHLALIERRETDGARAKEGSWLLLALEVAREIEEESR